MILENEEWEHMYFIALRCIAATRVAGIANEIIVTTMSTPPLAKESSPRRKSPRTNTVLGDLSHYERTGLISILGDYPSTKDSLVPRTSNDLGSLSWDIPSSRLVRDGHTPRPFSWG